MYCKYCGKKLEDGVSFCSECGKPVQGQPEKKKQEQSEKKNHPKKKKTTKKAAGILVTAAVVVLAVAAVVGYKYIGLDLSKQETGKEYKDNQEAEPQYVTETGKLNEPEEADSGIDMKTGLTKIKGGHTGKKVGYVNENGEEIIPPIYDKVSELGENGLIRAEYYVGETGSGIYDDYQTGVESNTIFFNENGEKVYDYVREFVITPYKESNVTVVREGRDYFLIDREGNRICEESYDYIENCDEYGNFIVRQGIKQGIINEKGKVILEPADIKISYIYPGEYDNGAYIVTGDQVSQIITVTGENPVTWQEGQITNVSLSYQRYQINLSDGTTEIRDFDGNVITSTEYQTLLLQENGFICKLEKIDGIYRITAILDHNGNEMVSDENSVLYLRYSFFEKGIGSGLIYDTYDDKVGLITLNGKLSLPCIYDNIQYWSDKQLIVYEKEKRTGVMNLEGDVLWETDGSEFEVITNNKSETDFLIIERNGKYGLVNISDGETILDCVYEDILKGNEEASKLILKKNGKYQLWNRKNKTYTEIPCNEDYFIKGYVGEFFEIAVDKNRDGSPWDDESGIIDQKGNCILEPVYDDITYDEQNEIFYVEVYENDQIGILDKNGQFLVPMAVYKRIVWDTNLIFIIPEEGNSRCLDYKGNELYITDGEVDSYLGGGYLAGYEGDQCFVATSDGGDIMKLDYNWIDTKIKDGIIMVRDRDDMFGYIDVKGEEIINCTNPYPGEYKYGTISVENDDGKMGLMNLQQEMLIDCQYDFLDHSGDGNCLTVREDGYWKIIDINNRVIVENMYGIEELKEISFSNARGGNISTSPKEGESEEWDYCGNKLK